MYYDQIKLLKQGVEKARGLLGDAIDVVPGLGTVNQGLLAAENIGRGNLAGAAENIQNLVPTGKIAGRAIKALTKGKGQSEVGNVLGANSAKEIEQSWSARGINGSISEKGNKITLNKIIVPKEMRGSGLGTQAMNELLSYADATGKTVALTPSADFGGQKSRLDKFYKGLGFEQNKGRSRDFEISESMLRKPKALGIQGGLLGTSQDSSILNRYETDADRRMEIARRNAALPVEQGGLGLPEDNTPMDRANAMGFDVDSPLYHGSPDDFSAFDKDMVKSRFKQSIGFHFANTPSEAKIYAGTYNEPKQYLVQRGNEMRIDIPEGGPYTTASMKADYDRADIINNLLSAKNAGAPFDSVRISKTMAPDWQEWGAVNENTVMFDPTKIRLSEAAFDPMRRNESDLLALQGGQYTPQDLLGFERMMGLLGE